MPDVNPLKIVPQPIGGETGLAPTKKKRSVFKILSITITVITTTIVIIVAGLVFWYFNQLSPVGGNINQLEKITITSGSSTSQVGELLKSKSIIKSALVFDIYVRLSGKSNSIKVGTYRLSPAESVQQIVEHLVKGSVDTFNITFYPGATLVDNSDTPKNKKYDVTTVLKNAGYTEEEIKQGLVSIYNDPEYKALFDGSPTFADLEGYIYGETYNFNVGATVEDIFTSVFKEFYQVIEENDLVAKFSNHGLTLYQGITLASIIQREANTAADQKQVAQVFYSRLAIGMELGSDVTYQYIADKTGVARDPNLDSAYNTRRYPGLPPGPIAVPGLSALMAVADPATGDYLYFLSGDDDVTYFAKTYAEHEANIVNHCKIKCSTL